MDTLWFTTPSPLFYKRFPTEIKSFQLFHNNTLKHIHSQSVGFSVVGYQQRGRHVQALGISKLDAETQAMNQTPTCEDLRTSVIGLSDTIVGVLGGGQLGRMLCQAASKMGVKVAVLDPMENCPASAISHRHVVGSFRDTNAVQKFAKECGVITVEIEHVDVDTLDVLEKQGMDCQPNASTIRLIQDKYMQKVHFREHNVPLPDFMQIDCFESAKIAGDMFSYPLMIKSRRLAYDGRGNAVANCEEDISTAVSALGGFERGLYAEKWAPFIKELAVIVARGRDGTVCCFPVVETTHKDSICHMVEAPADVSTEVREMAVQVAKRAVSSLKGAGVFAVELFLTGDGQILLNEIAPRPHNSGHHTIEACYVSQFEQHLRAILGLPLGDASMKVPAAIMYNLLGEDEGEKGFIKAHQLMKRAVSVAGASVHWYEKPEMRKQRKMGHITVVGSSMDLVRAWMKLIVDGETQDRSLSSRSTQPLEKSTKVPAAASSGNDNSGYGARAWKRWGSGTQRRQKTTTRPVISGPGPEVGIIMGSDSDLPVMKAAAEILKSSNVSYEITIVSAHRTPDRMAEYAKEARGRGIKVIIAGAGGAAHLPGMTASMTTLPVLGVPIRGSSLDGMDSLPSIVQMPKGIPVATFAIQNATNAALFAVQILAIIDANLHELSNYQIEMKETVIKEERLETIGWEPQRTHASIINRSLHGSPEVGIIMGSDSDLPVMTAAAEILKSFNVSYEITIESAHQTPDRMAEYAKEAHGKGIKVIIAGAGGAANLPGMIASITTLTVLGVPVKDSSLDEMDSLLSIVQMREGVPVATFAIQNATNAALFAVRILALINANLHERLSNYQIEMEETIIKKAERLETIGWEAYMLHILRVCV